MYSSAACSYARKILLRIRADNGRFVRAWLCREGFGVKSLRPSSAELSRNGNDCDEVRSAQYDIATTCKDIMKGSQRDR